MLDGGDNTWLLDHLRDPALSTVRVLSLSLMLDIPNTADVPNFLVRRVTGPSFVQVAHRSSELPG